MGNRESDEKLPYSVFEGPRTYWVEEDGTEEDRQLLVDEIEYSVKRRSPCFFSIHPVLPLFPSLSPSISLSHTTFTLPGICSSSALVLPDSKGEGLG